MDPIPELPDLPQNAVILSYLRGQASPPSGPDDWVLGSWQLHAHTDLIGILRSLAPGWPLTAAYGLPLLAWDGVAAVVAFGTDFLALRIDDLPADVDDTCPYPHPERLFVGPGWSVVPIWRSHLHELAADALLHAGELAAG